MDKTQIPAPRVLSQILDDMRIKGRYQWVLASRPGEPVLPVKVPRDFSWDSSPSVKKMAERYNVDGILWIQQRDQEIILKWYDGKAGMPLVFESTFLRSDGKDPSQDVLRVSTWIASIWARFPGAGFVAKRDAKYLYFEGAQENSLQVGDMVNIIRVESVTRHDLFKTIAEFKTSQVGQAKILSVEKLLAKAEIKEESSLDPVKMGDRYELVATQVLADKSPLALSPKPDEITDPVDLVSDGLGSISASIGYGKTAHLENTVDTKKLNLQRNAPALELNSMLYITSKWLGLANYRYRFATFTDPPAEYTQGSINARFTSLAFLLGHRFMLDASTSDLWIVPFLGYRNYAFTAAKQSAKYGPASKSWNSLAMGVLLRFPLNDLWHLRMQASKSMFVAYSEKDELGGGNPRPSAGEVGASVWLKTAEHDAVGAGFRYQTLGVIYDGVGERAASTAATSMSLKISEFMLTYESKF